MIRINLYAFWSDIIRVQDQSDYRNYVRESTNWLRTNVHYSAVVGYINMSNSDIEFNDARYETLFRLKYSEYIR